MEAAEDFEHHGGEILPSSLPELKPTMGRGGRGAVRDRGPARSAADCATDERPPPLTPRAPRRFAHPPSPARDDSSVPLAVLCERPSCQRSRPDDRAHEHPKAASVEAGAAQLGTVRGGQGLRREDEHVVGAV